MQPKLIHMWSGPRNVSTALMYSFAQRTDTEVVDEPLYGYYLRQTGVDHPGRDTVLAAQPDDAPAVLQRLQQTPSERPFRLCKQMAHHLTGVDQARLEHDLHFILTRAPEGVLTSLVNQIPKPTLADTGYAMQVELLQRWPDMPVVDSSRLLDNPEAVLRALCIELGLSFEPSMLSWPTGPKPYDGVWADWWYDNVHRSTRFDPPRPMPDSESVPTPLQPLLAECRLLYDQLLAAAIQP